ncbi:MAG: HesA/MoeB/ThiF family protein [Cellvibrionaceae bacterium]|nr:HesA/MoeB/ThiF family protein [Cellvibrionaceae bacterium]
MNDEQLLRYSRHILLPQLDVAGQQALLDAHVLIYGLGGLGSPVALYLAAAGVGEMTLVDFDRVDLSNLQRQILHTEADIGRPKTESAAARLGQLNSTVKLNLHSGKFVGAALEALLDGVDLALDCSDRYASRFALNRACVATATALVSAAAMGLDGQLLCLDLSRPDSPCYACLYNESDDEGPACAEAGVLAPLVGVVGTMQALAATKMLVGMEQPLAQLQCFDGRSGQWRSLGFGKKADCPVCSS